MARWRSGSTKLYSVIKMGYITLRNKRIVSLLVEFHWLDVKEYERRNGEARGDDSYFRFVLNGDGMTDWVFTSYEWEIEHFSRIRGKKE